MLPHDILIKSQEALMKTHTILGGTGFIGSRLAHHLDSRGISCWTPKRGDSTIFDIELGHIIYCIGLTSDFLQKPFETIDAHVCFLSNLLNHAHFSSLVYLSSTRLYDGLYGLGQEDMDLMFNPNNPRNLFDLSKAAGEAICLAGKHPKVVVARVASVYESTLDADIFLHKLIKQSLRQNTIILQTSNSLERDYVHIDDVCEALVHLSGDTRHRIYNIASGNNLSNRKLFSILEKITNCRINIPTNFASLSSPRIDITRLRDEFGWTPFQAKEKIPSIISYYRTKPIASKKT
jgi:nucleoside-diphosphate-sugar epimerase